jgi:hypothetical protein
MEVFCDGEIGEITSFASSERTKEFLIKRDLELPTILIAICFRPIKNKTKPIKTYKNNLVSFVSFCFFRISKWQNQPFPLIVNSKWRK